MSETNNTTEALDPYADNPDVVLREHTYDGIQEYDQKLPNWWLWSLYIFIVLFIGYWVAYYQLGFFPSDQERVNAQVAAIEAEKAQKLEELMGSLDDSVLWEMSRNTKITSEGEATYKTTCAACHAPDLEGNLDGSRPQYVGLPLSDSEWKYGGKPLEIMKIVAEGSPDKTKGMMPWKDALGGEKVAKVVAFILSKHPVPEGNNAGG
jgi:cytochrome c oxidase cbb3-type subunit 3